MVFRYYDMQNET